MIFFIQDMIILRNISLFEDQMLTGVSILIPVYRSEAILPELAERLAKTLPGIADQFEVLMVCDGSPDNSWAVIKNLAAKYGFIKGINLNKNYGQHNALLTAIREAKFDYIVTMDDDLQHPPEEIYKLLTKLQEGHDVVYGTSSSLKHSLSRNFSSRAVKCVMQQLMGYEQAQNISAFRAFRTILRNSFADYKDRFVNVDILLTWATNRFSSINVDIQPRHSGVSGYNVRKLLLHAINLITSFSSIPLQVASLAGFIFMFLGLIIFLYVLINYFIHGGAVPGFTFIASMISLFSGVQLFSLGIMGEYLSRIHFRSMGQPFGIIRERTND